jgi:hypothetical protein
MSKTDRVEQLRNEPQFQQMPVAMQGWILESPTATSEFLDFFERGGIFDQGKQGSECTFLSCHPGLRRSTHSRSGPDTTAKLALDGRTEAAVAQRVLALQIETDASCLIRVDGIQNEATIVMYALGDRGNG